MPGIPIEHQLLWRDWSQSDLGVWWCHRRRHMAQDAEICIVVARSDPRLVKKMVGVAEDVGKNQQGSLSSAQGVSQLQEWRFFGRNFCTSFLPLNGGAPWWHCPLKPTFLSLNTSKGTILFSPTYGTLSKLYINYLILHTTYIPPIALIDHKNGNAMVNH